MSSPVEQAADVHGLIGRKRLQRHTSSHLSPESEVSETPAASTDGKWMDDERKGLRAYEYLCHVSEAKEWIETCIQEDIGPLTELDENLRNGIILAKLARFFQPTCVKKIVEASALQFRHSDNVNFFYAACRKAGLPEIFLFELTDVYDKKNIPKVVYCIHALSHFLAKKGIATKIKNLLGKLEFTDEELKTTENNLQEAGVTLPQFRNVAGALAKELDEETDEEKQKKHLDKHMDAIIQFQAFARAFLVRKYVKEERKAFSMVQSSIVTALQAHGRGYLVRLWSKSKTEEWRQNVDLITRIQAHIRGARARCAYKETLAHYKNPENLKKIVQIQSFFKAKQSGKAYKHLTENEDVSVQDLQQFVHLLDDSNLDFEEELELEQLKLLVIKRIRENNQTEQLLNELDIKIALLVRNRITLSELMNTRGYRKMIQQKQQQQQNSQSASTVSSPESPNELFAPSRFKSLDKESRRRLELYQNLFYLLQTQTQYLAKLVLLVRKSRLKNFMDQVLLTLFNYANSAREEFLLLKLFKNVIRLELESITDFSGLLKDNPVFIKLAVYYNRGAKERLFLRELLQPLVKNVIQNETLDLETDPLSIYRMLIREEESQTGEASKRPYDITRDEALKDPETQKIFAQHLKELKNQTDVFLKAIIANVDKMPYGLRYITRELNRELKKRWSPKTPDDELRLWKVIGNLVYYRYMNPAIVAPEAFDVIEMVVNPLQRKNLAEISKMLQQIAVDRRFDSDNTFLAPLNTYIASASQSMIRFFRKVTDVQDPEEHFEISELLDLAQTTKPVIYIAPQELFNTHAFIMSNLDDVAPNDTDALRTVIKKLGPAPPNSVTVDYCDMDMTAENSDRRQSVLEQEDALRQQSTYKPGNEISLTLSDAAVAESTNLLGTSGNDEASYRNLFLETKRAILYIIRVQPGKSLLKILQSPTTDEHEKQYVEIVELEKKYSEEQKAKFADKENAEGLRRQLKSSVSVLELDNVSFAALKKKALENLEILEKANVGEDAPASPTSVRSPTSPIAPAIIRVTRINDYRDILTSIAQDIRNKHRRRMQRKNEMKTLIQTLENLSEKSKYLEEQKKTYHDYINSCMAQLLSNRKKSNDQQKFAMPFSTQWYHRQELKKQGKVPQFGSYKYSAEVLHKKGVLISIDGYSSKQYDKISLTISSDESGVFNIEVSIFGVKMPQKMEIKLEELLQYQFDNQPVIPLFDGAAKVNVNLLIFLINKKFYK